MATYTSNYGFHQWAPEDNFLRTDFNTDLQKIDTALGDQDQKLGDLTVQNSEKVRAVYGSYVGKGGNGNTRITLGGYPYIVGIEVSSYFLLGTRDRTDACLKLNENGFTVNNSGSPIDANMFNETHYYFALIS